MNCLCLDTGLQVLISSVAITTTTIVAFTGYQVGKNNFLNRKLKKSEKHQEINKTSCEVKLEKVVEVVENKYENIDNDVTGEENVSGDVTVKVDDETTEPSAPTKDEI